MAIDYRRHRKQKHHFFSSTVVQAYYDFTVSFWLSLFNDKQLENIVFIQRDRW